MTTLPESTNPAPVLPPIELTPEEAELTWIWDDMHTPHALTPLAGDYAFAILAGVGYMYHRLGVPMHDESRLWNGYWYYTTRIDAPKEEWEALDKRLEDGSREHMWLAAAYWRDTALPAMHTMRAWFGGLRPADLPLDELATRWEEAWTHVDRAWAIHMYIVVGPYQATEELAKLYGSVVEDAPPGEALRLITGGIDDLHAMARGLERLVALAEDEPAVARSLTRPAPGTLEELEADPAAASFVAELRAFLDVHGHLGGSFDDLALPSWIEQPGIVLSDIGKRIGRTEDGVDERRARLAAEADELAGRVRTRLADRPDELARFEELLALAREIGPLTEGHNYWIDRLTQSLLRRFVRAVGARLAGAGVVAAADDVFYLTRDEVPALLRDPAPRQAVVAERRALHELQRRHTPPKVLGKPRTSAPSGLFGGARFASDDEDVLRGTGASAGVVRGTARVVLGPQDFDRVRTGEIIVAPSSNPSWVPLFTIAAGLLTNTGGVLSHAAVVAREFGLPAVVGLGDATTRVADGRLVELDGTTGIVRLL